MALAGNHEEQFFFGFVVRIHRGRAQTEACCDVTGGRTAITVLGERLDRDGPDPRRPSPRGRLSNNGRPPPLSSSPGPPHAPTISARLFISKRLVVTMCRLR